ncbi:MAG TPA: hypothetical protein PLY90_07290, partial [Candidatus Hydrogenedentes bacterium]|nr:hypothetical protein [Candidatus Hydrogenedentota bacterium]HQB03085.1 hypothetical protein [Candidatus Hydrogenedentota bacterium]
NALFTRKTNLQKLLDITVFLDQIQENGGQDVFDAKSIGALGDRMYGVGGTDGDGTVEPGDDTGGSV